MVRCNNKQLKNRKILLKGVAYESIKTLQRTG